MAEIIACPICTRKLRLPDEYTRREVRCPSCQTIFVPELPSTSFAAGASEVQNETLVQAVQAGIPDISRPDVTPELRADEEDVSQRIVHRDSSRKSSPRKMLVGAAAVLVAIAAMIGIMALVLKPVLDPPLAQRFEDDEQRREEVKAAFAEQKALDVDEIAKELMPLFDGLREAFQARNRKLILTHIDFDRMLDELTASGLLPAGVRLERHGFLRGVEKGMGPAMEEQAQFMQWTAHEIKSIKKLQGNEAVVIVRHKTDDGFTMKMRWWVSKRSGSWRVFDYEDLDAGMRVTTLVASMGEIGLAGVPAATGAIKNLQKAMVAIAMQRDPDTAERHLRAAQGAKLPRQLEALRSLVKALIHLQRNQSKEALAEIEVTQGLHPDMPMLDFLKTVAFNNLGEYDKALKHIEAYRALLGEDSGICFELAEALHGLQRFAEAIAAYRRSLDYDARNGDAFLGLVRALGPDDDRTELAKRFAKLDRHRENFDVCADDCRQARDGAGLEQIALAMRKIDPNYEPATYHLGLAKLWLGKADEAAPIFQAALAKEKNAARRQDYLQGYMQAMVDRGMALDGYAALPDAREAFAGLAAELKQSFRFDDLRRLIALHGKKDGADPLLLLYQGELHVQDGRYDLADKTFREAATKKLEATALARFVSSRVAARYHTSGAMSAYADFGPARETFQQLAQLCLDDDRDSQLQALLEAHAKNDPHDELIFSHRVRLAARQDKWNDAVALFKTEFAKAPAAEQRNRVVSDFVFASIDAGKPLEAYQAVPDRVLAFQYLCEDLRDQNSSADLRRLIAAHAQSHPNDIRLKLQKAEMLVDDKQWAQALPLLEQGMKEAPQELRGMFRSSYVFVMHKMGRGLEALGAAPDKNDFLQLANLAVQDKQPAQLEALIAAYRKGAGDDADTFAYEARAKSMANKPAEALALLQRVWQKPNSQPRRRNDIINFVFDMHELGQGLAAYKAAPDKLAAFENLARRLAADKKPKELQELVDEHANHHAADPWLRYFRGELHLLQGAASAADQEFVAALAQAPARDKQMFRIGLYRARVASGKTVATYREFGADIGVFDSLANECFTSKNAKELAALLAAHRQSAPDAASQSMWDLELHWLKREYAAVQKILDEQKALFAQPRFRWKAEQYRVRCLIKQNKTQEALAEVERLTKKKRLDSLLLILAHAARGDAKQTLSAMEGLRPQPYFIASCYRDDDLGPILRGEAFAAFREKYPPPKGETGDE